MKQIKTMVLTVGGGSAGHVAPVLAVIDELAARHPAISIRFWCDRGFMPQSRSLMQHATIEVKVEKIFAGKFRRYHGASWRSRLTDAPTMLKNFADLLAIALGFIQSFIKLVMWRPEIVFCKGGFVCLPVGYAAVLLRIPLVIHDSDTHPGLTNRLLARHATFIATGAPLKYYHYPAHKASYVGIPTAAEFRHYTEPEKTHTKALFQLMPDKPLVVVIGGGLGAKKINDALVQIAPELVRHASVVHVAGLRDYETLKTKVPQSDNYKLLSFVSQHLAQLLGAADVVVSRAGASATAELAAVGAAMIMIPATQLADQQKNATMFAEAKAARIIDENRLTDSPKLLLDEILLLLKDRSQRNTLQHALAQFARPEATRDVVDLIEKA